MMRARSLSSSVAVLLRLALAVAALDTGSAWGQTLLRLPFDDAQGTFFLEQPIFHADHDPEIRDTPVECSNYKGDGFPWCYDEHRGTDFLLKSGFGTMDSYDVPVVAGADGEVVEAEDGHYDRCHGEPGLSVSCDGYEMLANHVDLRHADGLVTTYYHLKKGSVQVSKGDRVTCGQLLGFVGSSGISATPHLHLGLYAADGRWIDPFAGPNSQVDSYWVQQDGPRGRPAPRCQGEPVPPPDGGPGADRGVLPDSGPQGDLEQLADSGGELLPVRTSGCALGDQKGSEGALSVFCVLCALLVGLARPRRRTARRSDRDR